MGRSYWRLWAATATSAVGDGFALVAFPLLAASLTDRPALVAGVLVAQRLPWLLFGVAAGAFADRIHRGHLMVAADVVRGLLLLGVVAAGIAGSLTLALLYAAAFAAAAVETLFDSASQAALPLLVEEGQLDRGNSFLMAAMTGGQELAGPAVAGLVIAFGAHVPLGIDAVTFLASAVLLGSVAKRLPRPERAEPTSVRRDIAEGLRFFAGHDLLRTLALVVGTFAFCQAMVLGVLVLLATRELGVSEAGYGVFLAVVAVGNVVGALVAPRIKDRVGALHLLVGAGVVSAVAYVGLGVAPNAAVAASLLALEAVAVACGSVVNASLRQSTVPNELLGRVGGAFRTCLWGAMPLGAAFGGVVATVGGLRTAAVAAGAVQLCVLAVAAPRLAAVLGRPVRVPVYETVNPVTMPSAA